MCGQLLSASQEKDGGREDLQLVSEELKAAAEAAMKEAGRGSRPSSESKGEAAPPARAPRDERKVLERRRKEKMTVIAAAIVTILAIAYLLYWFLPKRGGLQMPGTGETRRAPSTAVTAPEPLPAPEAPQSALTPPAGMPIAPGQQTPTQEQPAEETEEPEEAAGETERTTEADLAAMEESAVQAAYSSVNSVLSVISRDLGVGLSTRKADYQGAITQQGDNTAVVAVSFQGNRFSGKMNILLRRYGQGWKAGWQATHYSNLEFAFSPPVIVQSSEADLGEERIAEAHVETGGFEPLESLSEPELPLEYVYR
jgi:type IV secretory pathway VirB10-like protein